MRNTFIFNLVTYLFVILLFLAAPIYGALAQFALGIIQLIIAIYLKTKSAHYSKGLQQLLSYYWIQIALWFTAYVLFANLLTLNDYNYLFLFIIPMCIGLYLVFVHYLVVQAFNY
ncbi:hypothetical protein [Olleya sp. HaHaR_3_96]|uniref:hypothetical protein n=1 Tax=Olleya sp. HaHaR_3_96 TaxID=2745560 RepID=UPI001C501CAF|nr:hypothetical protein [Olleya sp. HaHaR_3_96]QXP61406.1 hypothetical protein H0I26_07155 [Olleya sp. HaHaR_3_96]